MMEDIIKKWLDERLGDNQEFWYTAIWHKDLVYSKGHKNWGIVFKDFVNDQVKVLTEAYDNARYVESKWSWHIFEMRRELNKKENEEHQGNQEFWYEVVWHKDLDWPKDHTFRMVTLQDFINYRVKLLSKTYGNARYVGSNGDWYIFKIRREK
jgi:hypothetical protein